MSSQPRKNCQHVNLNHAHATVIGSSLICCDDNLVPPPHAEIHSAFPDMYTQDEFVEFDEEVLCRVSQIKVTLNGDAHRLQGLIHVQDQEQSSIRVEVEDQVNKLKASFNDTLKNKLDEHAKKMNKQVQGKIHSSIDKKLINYTNWLSYSTVSVPQPRICWQNPQCQGAK